MNTEPRRQTVKLCVLTMAGLVSVAGVGGCGWAQHLLCSMICPPGACCDRDQISLDGRGIQTLIRRTGDDREARFDQVTPSNGGIFGTGLSLYENGQQESFRFGTFQWCIETGNGWVPWGWYVDNVVDEAPDADTESTTEDASPVDAENEWELNNIRVTAAPNTGPLIGWHVNVYVDDAFIITIYKDSNTGPAFTEAVAKMRAQAYLDILQGWTR